MAGRIAEILEQAVADGAVPNAVAIVGDRDGVRYEAAAGTLSPTDDGSVDGDTVYRIMSMTKIITTTAALQLVEQGHLDLDAPVETYLPEFADRKVLSGFDGDEPQYRDPASAATVRQLVTHTAGHGYMFFNEDIHRWEEVTGYPGILSGERRMLDAPLLFDPGERFEYGINTDVLGAVVAAVAGRPLDVLVTEGILDPLGMRDTTYRLTDAQRSRLTPVQVSTPDGWVDSGVEYAQDPELVPGGHGLYSTPRDYLRFERALLRGGELDGRRILQEATVRQMFSNQIGALDFPAEIRSADHAYTEDFLAGPGWKWGLGLLLNPQDLPGMRRAGSGSWAGLCNTHFWIDPQAGVVAGIYSQTLPFVSPGALQMYQAFEQAVYAEVS
ncbi:serine hydrolase domain-containing protein [Cumulibacter manganitolerans]|uniref:serine hydrolase domain-containing protein n=1 Tax=Cumulibacter manganitolerans TaxID=1884992 RepID=UPI001296B8B8|nr:serine hydrolase domain-containing protein [Cumulibacter manganitolerans]